MNQRVPIAGFRTRLWLAMMVVVTAVTAIGLFFAQRNVASNVERDFRRDFQQRLAALHAAEEVRHALLSERCRALARKPRLHAALEDNALDLLYLSARDELAEVLGGADASAPGDSPEYALNARYYRFLDAKGAVIRPSDSRDAGGLPAADEARLRLSRLPDRPLVGYLWRGFGKNARIDEIMVMPIVSTETGEVISAIALGFDPPELREPGSGTGILNGLWLQGRLRLPGLSGPAQKALSAVVTDAVAAPGASEGSLAVKAAGSPYLLFFKRLAPDSPFPPAFEVSLFPLADSLARQRRLAWQFAGAGGILLCGALGLSRVLSSRLSVPVEKLAADSETNRAQRERAEIALESTSRELQRSARFSADASHQLKTPVTVLRAGLEELLAGEALDPAAREEVALLVHQTFRLTGIIEDLLLLSRMDAGRLRLEFSPVNLSRLIDAWTDDFGAVPDGLDVEMAADFPPDLHIAGENRYTALIVENLLENARKYNRPGGTIRIAARQEGESVVLTIANTGRPIDPAAREHVFERFHRGSAAENVPGHGLGLNLARELARLHGGDLRLLRSDGEMTEFEVRFRASRPAAAPAPA